MGTFLFFCPARQGRGTPGGWKNRTVPFCAFILLSGALASAGCAPIVVGGAAVGASFALDRRSAGAQIDDQTVEMKAYDLVRRDPELTDPAAPAYLDPTAPGPEVRSHIQLTAYNGVVLLTGEVPSEAARERLEKQVQALDRVRRVHNELTVGPPVPEATTGDAYLTAKVRTRLLAEKDFDSDAVKVVTTGGTVYLMGLVSHQEAEVATTVARTTSGVERVVRLFELIEG
jgi:osmotically-inducible protein OsmY